MKNLFMFLFIHFIFTGSGVFAQMTHQIVVGNGGIYNNDADHVTITGINPNDYASSPIGEIIRESIQDLIVVENLAFVAAEDSLVKFDLVSNTKMAAVFQPNLSRLYASEEVLYVSLRTDFNGPPADGVYLRAFDFELNELYETTEISTDAAGMCRNGDSLYVAVPGDWQATEGRFAVVSLDFNYVREENWGADAVGIYDIFKNDNILITVNKSPYGATSGSVSLYGANSGSLIGTNVLDHVVGKGVAFEGELLYLGLDYGIGSYSIISSTVVNAQIVPDPGSVNFINIAATVLDTVNDKFYVTITDYFSLGQGIVYDMNGTELGNFDAAVSAEAMAVHYDLGSNIIDIEENVVNIYPNPFGNSLRIDAKNEILEVSVYNTNGNKVFHSEKGETDIYDLSHLKNGLYIIKIETTDKSTFQKILKQ